MKDNSLVSPESRTCAESRFRESVQNLESGIPPKKTIAPTPKTPYLIPFQKISPYAHQAGKTKPMNHKEFQKKVEQGLKHFNKEQQIRFAWRCAVRALPFLGYNGNFNFWEPAQRQQHMYAVVFALDAARATATTRATATVITTARAAATVADTATRATARAYATARATATARAYATARAATAATYAAATARATATAATAATAAAAAAADQYIGSIILQDLNALQTNNQEIIPNLIARYGQVWDNFQKALAAEGCAYWGQLYQRIFDKGLVLDEQEIEALYRRLNVPEEIRKQGAAAVGNFLEELEKGATRLNEARIIILGDKGSGKTSIARRLITPKATMPTEDDSTAGVNTLLWKLEDENINVRIWDFAGHTVTHAVHQFFLSERCLYLMVHNSRTENNSRLNYWLDHMKNYGGENSKAIILVNKRDKHYVDIPVNNLTANYLIAGNYNFSIKDDTADLEKFRKDVAALIKDNPSWEKQQLPISYYQVKEELEAIFDKGEKESGREHISRNEFDQIANRYKVKDADQLLKDLHYLGISLWYQDMDEFDTLVLNPEWISHGVYKIINWVSNEKRHSLTLEEFKTVFSDDLKRYPAEKHPFLFRLMKRYELAYETRRGNELIIPHLLNEDRPQTLPDFPVGESLMLRYKAEQPLPPNTISRFIVRHNQQIQKYGQHYFVWRHGVILQQENSIALVMEEDRTISVSVKGNGKSQFLSALRDTLNEIFKSYKSKTPELQYRIERYGLLPEEVEKENPLWLPDQKIMNLYRRAKPYYDDVANIEIPMPPVVKTYNIKVENLILGGSRNQIIKDSTINNSFRNHFLYLIRQPANYNIKDKIMEAIQDLNTQNNAQIIKEIEKGINSAFAQATGNIDRKLNQIYADLQKTDNMGMKLKLSVPLLNLVGIQLETQFDIKNWAKLMYAKHKKEIFNIIANARSRDLGAK